MSKLKFQYALLPCIKVTSTLLFFLPTHFLFDTILSLVLAPFAHEQRNRTLSVEVHCLHACTCEQPCFCAPSLSLSFDNNFHQRNHFRAIELRKLPFPNDWSIVFHSNLSLHQNTSNGYTPTRVTRFLLMVLKI